jgi:hypothetical protein
MLKPLPPDPHRHQNLAIARAGNKLVKDGKIAKIEKTGIWELLK